MKSGWRQATLGDVCELKYGKALKDIDRSGSGYPVYGSNGVVGMHRAALTNGPTIVIGRKGSYGEINVSAESCWPIDTTYFVDSSCTSQDLKWLGYRLAALGLNTMNRAAAIPGLNREDAYRQELLLPPIEEQRRIVVVLDAADALRAKRRATLAYVDSITEAIFVDMFGESDRFPTGKLGDHVPTTSGGTPSRSRQDYFGGDVPWVKSGELASGWVLVTEERITKEAVANSSAKLMPPGTVLLAMYGATVGEVATLGIEAATNQAICCLAPTDEVTGPYLAGFLRSVKDELVRRAAGGAQPNISQTIIRDLDLPLPPIDVQAEYGSRVERVADLRNTVAKGAEQLDRLFASVQQRAFRGEL